MVVYAKAIDELSHFFYEAGVPEAEELGHSPREIERYRGVMDRVYEWTDRQIAPLVDAVDLTRWLFSLCEISAQGFRRIK